MDYPVAQAQPITPQDYPVQQYPSFQSSPGYPAGHGPAQQQGYPEQYQPVPAGYPGDSGTAQQYQHPEQPGYPASQQQPPVQFRHGQFPNQNPQIDADTLAQLCYRVASAPPRVEIRREKDRAWFVPVMISVAMVLTYCFFSQV